MVEPVITDMQTPAESNIATPKCPTCDVRMHLRVLVPRDDGGGEWRFSCPVCKTSGRDHQAIGVSGFARISAVQRP